MWNQLLEKLGSLDPGVLKNAALMIAGGFTGLVSTLMGEHKVLFYWLFAFVVADYLTGMIAAARTGTWSSQGRSERSDPEIRDFACRYRLPWDRSNFTRAMDWSLGHRSSFIKRAHIHSRKR